jgi:hypothetical protein
MFAATHGAHVVGTPCAALIVHNDMASAATNAVMLAFGCACGSCRFEGVHTQIRDIELIITLLIDVPFFQTSKSSAK